MLDDATVLRKLGDERFDLIVTDPPYRDDVAYAELSDFYYVWLRRVLREYHPEAFRYSTQWESLARFEVSYSEGRVKHFYEKSGPEVYTELLSRAFETMKRRLKEGGVLVVFFAHSSPEAWVELVETAWRRAGLRLTAAYPVYTESEERVTARGKVALEASILTVWRPGSSGTAVLGAVRGLAKSEAERALSTSSVRGADALFAAFASALRVFTSYRDVEVVVGSSAPARDVVREAMRLAVEAVVGASSSRLGPVSLAYAALKYMHGGKGEVSVSSQELITIGYGLLPEERLHSLLVRERIVEPAGDRGRGARVGKQKMYVLLSPQEATPEAVRRVAGRRRVDLVRLKLKGRGRAEPFTNAVDVLHVLEYEALQTLDDFRSAYSSLLAEYPHLVEEAEALAEAIAKLPGDPEAELCKKVLNMIEMTRE